MMRRCSISIEKGAGLEVEHCSRSDAGGWSQRLWLLMVLGVIESLLFDEATAVEVNLDLIGSVVTCLEHNCF